MTFSSKRQFPLIRTVVRGAFELFERPQTFGGIHYHQARKNHDKLLPSHVSTLAVTDRELIETFDSFAFDEVLRHGNLDVRTRQHDGKSANWMEQVKDIE